MWKYALLTFNNPQTGTADPNMEQQLKTLFNDPSKNTSGQNYDQLASRYEDVFQKAINNTGNNGDPNLIFKCIMSTIFQQKQNNNGYGNNQTTNMKDMAYTFKNDLINPILDAIRTDVTAPGRTNI